MTPADMATIRERRPSRQAYERLLQPGMGTICGPAPRSVGFAGTSGNARTLTFTTGVNAARVTSTDKTSLYFNTIKASALVSGQSADTAQAVRGRNRVTTTM